MTDGTLLDAQRVDVPATALNMARRSMDGDAFARYAAVSLYDITYASQGLRIKGWMALPPANPTPLPAVVFNRGGSGPRGVLSPEGAMMYAGLYASWGYVAVASNYRGLGGSEGAAESWGAEDVDDALNLLPLLDALDYVDPDRLGLVGGSRGGMMAFAMLARTKRFRAAATFGAPTMIDSVDNHAYIRSTMKKHLPPGSNVDEEARKRSVIRWADKLCPTTPLLLLHGTGDRRVTPDHSLCLALELQRIQHPYKLVMYDNADHVLAGRRNESNADIRWWLDTYVMHKAPLPRTGPHGA